MKALVAPAPGQGLALQEIHTPSAIPGALVVRVLAVHCDSVTRLYLSGKGPFTWPAPFVPGGKLIGRVHETGPDTTTLTPGQLVLVDCFIRGRDNRDVQLLWGTYDGPSPASKKLMADNWRNAGFAEYARVPLENTFPLNEDVLCRQFGYSIPQLIYLHIQLITYGGMRGIDLKAGETIIIAPATGGYSGAAVGLAVAMGARVVAVGRNRAVLERLAGTFPAGRVMAAPLTGDAQADAALLKSFGPADAYLDISPAQAAESTHHAACFDALRPYGRASLMGAVSTHVAVPHVMAMFKNLTIRGQYMYEREDVLGLIKLAETGVLKVGEEVGSRVMGTFRLDQIDAAFKCAEEHTSAGQIVVLGP